MWLRLRVVLLRNIAVFATLCGVLVVGLGATWYLVRAIEKSNELQIRERLDVASRAVADAFEIELTKAVGAADAASRMVMVQRKPNAEDWQAYASGVIYSVPSISVLEWAPLTESDNAAKSLLRTFVEPVGSLPLNVDLLAEKDRAATIRLSRDSGRPVATPVLNMSCLAGSGATADGDSKMAVGDDMGACFGIMAPMYEPGQHRTMMQRRGAIRGFVTAYVLVDRLFRDAAFRAAALSLDVIVLDVTDGRSVIFSSIESPDLRKLGKLADYQPEESDRVLAILAAERSWEVVLHPRPNFYTQFKHQDSSIAATIGILGVVILVLVLGGLLRSLRATARARKQAESAAHVKAQFLANMSHEIRTPMNAIIGLSDLALKNEMPQRVRAYVSKIRLSGEHLLGLINDILDLSKIESGKLEIDSVAFELRAVIDNVVNLVSEKAEDKGLELVCSIDPAVPLTLIGDPLRLGQVLINYANNAVKFTDQGNINLRVTVDKMERKFIWLKFSVTDTGIGLTQEQMDRLFRSFEQADKSTTRQYGGTGLGLAISKSLALAMGGKVGVNSVVGAGSTFWFTAKLEIGVQDIRVPHLSIDLHGSKVLVVDDNEDAATVLAEMLRELGFDVHQVHSGATAIQHIADAQTAGAPYAFVMIDWIMPGMDGLETVRAIQSMGIDSTPFVLMVTAHRREEIIKGSAMLGIEHVLSKPVNSSLLINTMMEIMGHTPESPALALPRNDGALEAQLTSLGGARILLVEDNEINQQVAREMLAYAGFAVEIADNGQVALEKVDQQHAAGTPYDIVLMDMQMPVMDGITASQHLRERYDSDTLPIVAMTANAMQADRERCMEVGMNGFVSKPINPDELWRALLKWVKVKPSMGAQAGAAISREVADEGYSARDASADATGPLIQSLRKLPMLNVDTGLVRMSNDARLYISLLHKFADSQADVAERIQAALAAKDTDTARRLAHTLCGVAGNLGVQSLQDCASKLEGQILSTPDDPSTHTTVKQLEALVQPLVAALQAVPGWAAKPAPVAKVSKEQLDAASAAVKEILALLEFDDSRASEVWQTHADALRTMYANADAIEKALSGFEFETAAELMQMAQAAQTS